MRMHNRNMGENDRLEKTLRIQKGQTWGCQMQIRHHGFTPYTKSSFAGSHFPLNPLRKRDRL
jgi:hypothetical protein